LDPRWKSCVKGNKSGLPGKGYKPKESNGRKKPGWKGG